MKIIPISLLFAILVVWYAVFIAPDLTETETSYSSQLPSNRSSLEMTIINDLRKEQQADENLARRWKEIGQLSIDSTQLKYGHTKNIALNIPKKRDGSYLFEAVFFEESPDDENSKIMVQFGLYELIKSKDPLQPHRGNKVWDQIKVYDP